MFLIFKIFFSYFFLIILRYFFAVLHFFSAFHKTRIYKRRVQLASEFRGRTTKERMTREWFENKVIRVSIEKSRGFSPFIISETEAARRKYILSPERKSKVHEKKYYSSKCVFTLRCTA
jgi:hypothetical protein